jgi:hypothetical protein
MVPHSERRETFEKCSILFKVKEGENTNPPDHHRDSQEYLEYFEE